jgi:2-phosphosulfolactate phosphatase
MTKPPRVQRLSLLAGARKAEGVAVVIDVLRAFTSAAFMAYLGTERLILHSETESVLHLKEQTGCLAVGEVGGKRPPGFDFGNSPARILAAGRDTFSGRTVAQRTSAGTQGAVAAAQQADAVILGSFVTAGAIARYVQNLSPSPEVVSLVAMGSAGTRVTPDDEECAAYIEHALTGRPYDHARALRDIVDDECTQQFLRGDHDYQPAADPVYCLQRDLFDFVLVATLQDGQLVARRIDVPGVPRI